VILKEIRENLLELSKTLFSNNFEKAKKLSNEIYIKIEKIIKNQRVIIY